MMENSKLKQFSFLEYYKTILKKVSFDQSLLVKEYHKALNVLRDAERSEFERWVEAEDLAVRLDRVKQPVDRW